MTTNETEDLKIRGMRCLMDNLGVLDATRFISSVLREQCGFAELRRKYVKDVSFEATHHAATGSMD